MPCPHDDSQRMLRGTWTSIELEVAVERGYVVQRVHEVWHWDKCEQYDPKVPNSGLFSGYIERFLKLKQEASGWPDWVETDADRRRYVEDYERTENIRLEPDKIEKNAGLRSLAKLMLNSFWGVCLSSFFCLCCFHLLCLHNQISPITH